MVWIGIVPWYVITGATAGPEGPLGVDGVLGIVGFHLVSALLALASAGCAWQWRRLAPTRGGAILLAIMIALLIASAAAHLLMAAVAGLSGGTSEVFQVTVWRAGSIAALLVTLPILGLLVAATIVSAVGARRRTAVSREARPAPEKG